MNSKMPKGRQRTGMMDKIRKQRRTDEEGSVLIIQNKNGGIIVMMDLFSTENTQQRHQLTNYSHLTSDWNG